VSARFASWWSQLVNYQYQQLRALRNQEDMMAKNVVNVTDQEFEQVVLASETPVLVDFWAPWCGPCRAVAPILEDIAQEYAGQVTVAKVNTDEEQRYAEQFGIVSIPTLIIFKGGQEVDRIVGAGPKSVYTKRLTTVLA
jgi:thioredoxin 1